MTVTAKTDEEQQPGRVIRNGPDADQGYTIVDENGHRVFRFDRIIRDAERASLPSERIAMLMLDWQRHAWHGCTEDYLGLIWADAMERVVGELLEIFAGAVRSHLLDGFDRVGVEEKVNGLLDAMLNTPSPRPLRCDTIEADGPSAPCDCGCGKTDWPDA